MNLEEALDKTSVPVKTATFDGFKYGCLMFDLGGIPALEAAVKEVQGLFDGARDSSNDEPGIIEDGNQKTLHITLLYGIVPEEFSLEDFKEILSDYRFPLKCRIEAIEYFEPKEKPYDVCVLRVRGDDLEALGKQCKEEIPNENTHPVYKAHITVCYVKKGERRPVTLEDIGLDKAGIALNRDTITYKAPNFPEAYV